MLIKKVGESQSRCILVGGGSNGSQTLTGSHALYVADSKQPGVDAAERVAKELLDAGAADIAPLGESG